MRKLLLLSLALFTAACADGPWEQLKLDNYGYQVELPPGWTWNSGNVSEDGLSSASFSHPRQVRGRMSIISGPANPNREYVSESDALGFLDKWDQRVPGRFENAVAAYAGSRLLIDYDHVDVDGCDIRSRAEFREIAKRSYLIVVEQCRGRYDEDLTNRLLLGFEVITK